MNRMKDLYNKNKEKYQKYIEENKNNKTNRIFGFFKGKKEKLTNQNIEYQKQIDELKKEIDELRKNPIKDTDKINKKIDEIKKKENLIAHNEKRIRELTPENLDAANRILEIQRINKKKENEAKKRNLFEQVNNTQSNTPNGEQVDDKNSTPIQVIGVPVDDKNSTPIQVIGVPVDDTKTEECIEEKSEPQIGKLTLKVFPYDVNDGVNSKRFRIADYRIDLDQKPYSFYDRVNNGLKNLIRFEKKEGTFYPVYNVNGNDRELWYHTGTEPNLKNYKKQVKTTNPQKDEIHKETGVINPFKVDERLKLALNTGSDKNIKGLDLDNQNVIDSIHETQIKRLKEFYKWEREIITLDEFAKERIMLNKNIEIDLIPHLAHQLPQGGTRKHRGRQRQTSRKRNPKKLLTFHFDIVLKKSKNVPFRINRRLISSTPLKVPQKVLNKFTRKMKKPHQGHK
jgi:hypothetical protein